MFRVGGQFTGSDVNWASWKALPCKPGLYGSTRRTDLATACEAKSFLGNLDFELDFASSIRSVVDDSGSKLMPCSLFLAINAES